MDHRFGGVHSIRRSISQRGCPEAASWVEALCDRACAQQDAAMLPVLAQLLPAESVSPSRSASDGIASAKSGMAGEPRIALLGLSSSLNLCDCLDSSISNVVQPFGKLPSRQRHRVVVKRGPKPEILGSAESQLVAAVQQHH